MPVAANKMMELFGDAGKEEELFELILAIFEKQQEQVMEMFQKLLEVELNKDILSDFLKKPMGVLDYLREIEKFCEDTTSSKYNHLTLNKAYKQAAAKNETIEKYRIMLKLSKNKAKRTLKKPKFQTYNRHGRLDTLG